MDAKQIKKGEIIARKDSAIENLWYIADGTVTMDSGAYKITLKKGDFIGLADFDTGVHSFLYYASADTQLMNFSTRENLYNTAFYSSKPENSRALALSINRILRDSYTVLSDMCAASESLSKLLFDTYSRYCEYTREVHASIEAMETMNDAPEPVYMSVNQKLLYVTQKGMASTLSNKDAGANITASGLIPGYMIHSVSELHEIAGAIEYVREVIDECLDLMMSESEDDLYGRLGDIAIKATRDHSLYPAILELMEGLSNAVSGYSPELADSRHYVYERKAESMNSSSGEDSDESEEDKSVASKLVGSMNTIMEYANFPEEKATKLKEAVNAFKQVSDPFSSEDEVRRLRQVIEEGFYQLYLSVLQVRVGQKDVPVIIKMFLDFGYLDEELAGMKNACDLYNICLTFAGNPDKGVYTASEWLMAILYQKREPSINEFEQGYEEYIKEQVTNGRIQAAQAKAIVADRSQKVLFEIQNMFRRTSKMCSGQILAFMPVLCDYQMIRGPREDLLDPHTILEAIESIRAIDYSLFYRETMCVFSEKENIHDVIHVEVKPDIILSPVVGTRGAMWQEISGRDRTTPARFVFPVINVENLDKMVAKVLGNYRWEICKRMQGMRWNDVTDPSLTSLYCDYLQFYRKNSDLSPEHKEKVKIGLQRYKQNFKEYFVNDYCEYIGYESAGSPHLNKVARGILFSQCPFSADIRAKLADNPIYAEVSERYRIKTGQQLHKLDNIVKKLNSRGQPVTPELKKEIDFYNM
ncbi:MAG: Crp/Fnr family transcriptional regulator [Lachnospiraceae bacterium]|nr:Crp/Fnr family transcriptional regulator [Lachnospiraceae bacterium]